MSLPPCLPGFEHVNRFLDRQLNVATAKILPGEYYVTQRQEMITTVLGSCISVCIYDLAQKIGGMNHFMLPVAKDRQMDFGSDSFRFGDVAMERLINEVIKAGADRRALKFKAFGGGHIIKTMTSIGQSNIQFLKKFMALEGLHLETEDLGGKHPRKVRFNPGTGQVWVKKLAHLHNDTITKREVTYQASLEEKESQYGEVDLFE